MRHIIQPASRLLRLIVDAVCYLGLCLRSNPNLAAEVLFLRKQLALYEEREVKPRRAINATRIVMVWLSHCFDWRAVLYMVTLETFIRWQRQGVRWFWRQKAKPNRPALPKDLRVLKTPVRTPVANPYISYYTSLVRIVINGLPFSVAGPFARHI
jgi:hypothetical protein